MASAALEALRDFVSAHSRLFVVTGAGCSAPSGIGTYRADDGSWHSARPIQHQDFVGSRRARQRYWARSMRGWPAFARAQPNAAHAALAELEERDKVSCLVTQNVDGLHRQAGQARCIELHGSLDRVVCLQCGALTSRRLLQHWLESNNPQLSAVVPTPAPDGDADLRGAEDAPDIRIPECTRCGGMLKPDVVFYGDSVPRSRVDAAFAALGEADGLLVVGSSLMVYSSFRFCRAARERGIPMGAVNRGVTRADDWFLCKHGGDCAIVLPELL